ncbi:MAG TPA: tRNA pseudouridine(55) synthase TruB [Bacillota bacterium]|nr:tRNA pseudouridine(55) synthase TruB [Bacillota bacterium]
MNGIINIYKLPGMTSQQVVSRVRRLLGVSKAGHTGTLDPGVSGVLPVCLGKATKVAQWLSEKDKSYRGEVTFGITTDSQDRFGRVVSETDASSLSLDDITQAFSSFVGTIMQVPPMVSAVKFQGKRLYELARQGLEVERQARQAIIYSLGIIQVTGLGTHHPRVLFDVKCSKGTYVRTLCADLGDKLGTGGVMSDLVRTQSGTFTLEEGVTLEQLEQAVGDNSWKKLIIPIDRVLQHVPAVVVKDSVMERVKHGNSLYQPGILRLPEADLTENDMVRLYSEGGELLALARALNNPLHPDSLYFQPQTVF